MYCPEIVVTGFEPFGYHAFNPSISACRAAAESLEKAVIEVLPVTFAAASNGDWLCGAGFYLHFGLAAGSSAIRLERTATNDKGIRTHGGESDEQQMRPLDKDGPEQLQTELPVEDCGRELEKKLKVKGFEINIELSDDAGNYICNAVYYRTLRAAEASDGNWEHRSLFVHLPKMSELTARSIGRTVGECLTKVV